MPLQVRQSWFAHPLAFIAGGIRGRERLAVQSKSVAPQIISGSLSILFLFDVSEEIRLDELRNLVKAAPAGREPPFRQPAPEYVQFARPPVIEAIPPMELTSGERASGRIAYFDYGVVSIDLVVPFSGTWEQVVSFAGRWMDRPELERKAVEVVERHLVRARPALVDEYRDRLSEDYYVVCLAPLDNESGRSIKADDLIESCGTYIAQIVRGEAAVFSDAERREILESRMSYSDNDLMVVGWTAAVLYDTPEGAAPTFQLLEYANSQLLEFRRYDAVLSSLLADVYRKLERGSGVFGRWRFAREATRLNLIRLEIRELTERVDNSIKFLSDMFAARLYRMAAARIGVPDYRTLVEQKLESAGELYGFMMDRFYQGRAFVLELMVVIILIIELVFFFREK
jgi:hypothetical protein